MRFALLLSISVTLLPAQIEPSRVEGQVLGIDGAPLKKATVHLVAASQINQSNFSNYSAPTDPEGKFVIEKIKPGTYTLSAERAGYLTQFYGARSTSAGATQIKLDAGQVLKEIVIKLTPQGMIFGRVVDADGDPVPEAFVVALRWTFVDGKKQLRAPPAFWGHNANADGSFVLGHLPAGRYYVSASGGGPSDRTEDPGSKPRESNLLTYFPEALDVDSAAPIEVAAGAEVRGIEVRLRRGRVFEVRGQVQGAAGLPFPDSGNLFMRPTGKGGSGAMANIDARTKTFRFQAIRPGDYEIGVQYAEIQTKDPTGEFTKTSSLTGHAEVSVVDKDVVNVVLQLHPGPEVRGHVKMEGLAPEKIFADGDPPDVEVVGSDGRFHESEQVNKNGSFRVQGLPALACRISLHGLLENTYVKAINFDGRDITGKDLDLASSPGAEVEIVLSPNGAEVTGVVRDADGKPVPGAVVQLSNPTMTQTVNADQHGVFDMKGFAPGEYKAYAWEDRADGAIDDAGFRKAF